jgi:Ribosomal protein L14
MERYNRTGSAKKAAAQLRRSNLTDFQRFQVMLLRKKRAIARGRQVSGLKKQAIAAAKN